MAARVFSIGEVVPEEGEYSLILSALPGKGEQTIGVLLLDTKKDQLHLRLRRDWEQWTGEEDAEVFSELEDDLRVQALEDGGQTVLRRLEEAASQAIRVTDRAPVGVRNFEHTLRELYRQHVPAQIMPFRTHLPRYSLAVAAGPFLTNSEQIEAEEWVETAPNLKLDAGMFIARIQGQSMEPRIPDGSLCVFRRNVVGSRSGRLVLVRNSELADDNQYTVKRYKSEKAETEDGFQHTRVRLESLNPAFPSWDLDEEDGKYEVVAEFVEVLA